MAEKTDKPPSTKLAYIQFRDPVPVSCKEWDSLPFWSHVKHGAHIQAVERGNWIHLLMKTDRVRVPMTNVACIRDVEGEE